MKSNNYDRSVKKRWFDENSHRSQLLGNYLLPMRLDIGYYIEINDLEIPQKYFPKEYDEIEIAFFSVMKKLEKHFYNGKIAKAKEINVKSRDFYQELRHMGLSNENCSNILEWIKTLK